MTSLAFAFISQSCLSGWIRRGLTVLAVIALAGCASSGPIQPDRLAKIQKVGVVTLLPDALAYEKVGATVFNNESATRPVGDVFNAAAWRGAEKALKKLGREVIQVQADIPKLAQKIRSGMLHFDSPAEYIKDDLLEIIKKHQLDAVIIVGQSFDADNGINGIRMYFRGFTGVRYALLMPSVWTLPVDEKTRRLATGCCPSPRIAVQRPGGGEWQYKLADNMDSATHAYLSHMTELAIEDNVARNLRGMGF